MYIFSFKLQSQTNSIQNFHISTYELNHFLIHTLASINVVVSRKPFCKSSDGKLSGMLGYERLLEKIISFLAF